MRTYAYLLRVGVRRLYVLIAVLTGVAIAMPASATASQSPTANSGLGAKTPVGQPLTTLFSTKAATLRGDDEVPVRPRQANHDAQ